MRRVARTVLSFALSLALVAGFVPIVAATPAFAAPDAGEAAASYDANDSAGTAETTAETDGVLVVLDENATEGISLLSAEGENEPVARALAEADLAIVDETHTGDATILIAEPTNGASDAEAAATAQNVPGVAYAQPNYVYYLIDGTSDTQESDTDANASTQETPSALSAAGGEDISSLSSAASLVDDPIALVSDPNKAPNQYWIHATNTDEAWLSSQANHSVTVATFDSGVMFSHEDLADNLLTDLAWDAYNNVKLTSATGTGGDNGGHGTHVAGIIAGVANNGTGIAGASYNAYVLPIKVVNDDSSRKSSSAKLIAAYNYLFSVIDSGSARNVRVVNMSLGSYSDSMLKPVNDVLLEDQITKARDEYGIATVCAGGNGDQVSTPDTRPIYPADFEDSISVTALAKDGTNLAFSDYNEYKDISAPGQGIWSTYIRSGLGTSQLYNQLSGTSMAAPMVSGAFALLFAAVPDATVDEACEAIYATATPIVDPDDDRSAVSGSHGALDTAAAVKYLIENHVPTFPDVHENDWFYEAIGYVAKNGVMTGRETTGLFDPLKPLTRAEMAQVLYNYYGGTNDAPASGHTDVDQSLWYADAINWAVQGHLMKGDEGQGTFRPDDPITREETAMVLFNATSAKDVANPNAINALPDAGDTNEWALEAMTWAVGNGVINGVEKDPEHRPGYRELVPQETTTRAIIAQMLMNAMERGIL